MKGRVVMLMSGIYDPICVGAIFTDLNSQELCDLWDKWQSEVPEPDTDSEFIDWAIANNARCSAVPFNDFEFVTITE